MKIEIQSQILKSILKVKYKVTNITGRCHKIFIFILQCLINNSIGYFYSDRSRLINSLKLEH